MTVKMLIVALLVSLTVAQDAASNIMPELSQAEQVSRREQEIRDQNNMIYSNVKSYTFSCGRFDDFTLRPDVDETVKFQLHIYWKQESVYITSQYREGEEIRVIVYQDNNSVVLDREFYIVTGFSINAQKGKVYTIRFLAAGRVSKLVSMIMSSVVSRSEDKASKEHLLSAQEKIDNMQNEMKALLTISQRNFMMKQRVSEQVLSNTKLYMSYEVVEAIIIIVVSVLQVTFITKLLKGSSIV